MKLFFAALFFLAAGTFLAWNEGPGLVADYALVLEGRKAPISFAYKHQSRPECRVKALVISTCTVRYESRLAGGPSGTLEFGFFGPAGEGMVHFVESAETGIVSTDFQLDRLANRTLFLLVMVGSCLAMSLAAVAKLRRRDEAGAAEEAIEPMPIRPAPRAPRPAGRTEFGRRR
jgi:hypothetical protein